MGIKNLVGKDYIETNRLIIREMKQSDYAALCRIMCDEDVMHAAYGSAFNQAEVQGWLNRHLERYRKLGGDNGLDVVGLGHRLQLHVIVHHQKLMLQN